MILCLSSYALLSSPLSSSPLPSSFPLCLPPCQAACKSNPYPYPYRLSCTEETTDSGSYPAHIWPISRARLAAICLTSQAGRTAAILEALEPPPPRFPCPAALPEKEPLNEPARRDVRFSMATQTKMGAFGGGPPA